MNKIKDFFLNQLTGRIIVRAAGAICMYLASGSLGLAINVDPTELSAIMITGMNLLITALKPRVSSAPVPEAPKA